MICEIIVSKTMRGIFLIFCQSSFINNFMVKNNFSEPKNHRKFSRPIYFSAHCFVGLTCRSYCFDKVPEINFYMTLICNTTCINFLSNNQVRILNLTHSLQKEAWEWDCRKEFTTMENLSKEPSRNWITKFTPSLLQKYAFTQSTDEADLFS